MGILADALAIVCGSLVGSRFRKGTTGENQRILGIGILIVSMVGFLENIYQVTGDVLGSENLLAVLFAYILGTNLGEWLELEERIGKIGVSASGQRSAFWYAVIFFGVGGLQICGPVALAVHGDNSQLFLKSAVDLPFAVALGSAYGKMVALSAVPVALIQLLIGGAAFWSTSLFGSELVSQLCAMGYLILFVSGCNMLMKQNNQISNINMLPGFLLLILYHALKAVW